MLLVFSQNSMVVRACELSQQWKVKKLPSKPPMITARVRPNTMENLEVISISSLVDANTVLAIDTTMKRQFRKQ